MLDPNKELPRPGELHRKICLFLFIFLSDLFVVFQHL